MKGMTIQLVEQTQTGTDEFGNPVYTETLTDVQDCLVGQPTTDDVTTSIALYGKRCEYVVGIPRGDTHNWTDAIVVIWGARYRTQGYPMRGISENIPLRWDQNIKVERYG